jgi:hypothetical protein
MKTSAEAKVAYATKLATARNQATATDAEIAAIDQTCGGLFLVLGPVDPADYRKSGAAELVRVQAMGEAEWCDRWIYDQYLAGL